MQSIVTSKTTLGIVIGFALTFAKADIVYVADVNTGAIKKFDSAGHGSAFGTVGFVNPVDLALDGAGNLYVANRSAGVSGTIDRFDPAGHRSLFANAWFPSGLAFDRNGFLYAGFLGNNSVAKFDSAGQTTIFASSGLNGPVALAFDSQGSLYVANQDTSSIVKFDSAGQGSFFASSGLYPSGLAFDSSDNLYVANFGDNTVQKIDPTGVSTIFAGLDSGLNAPVDLAFDGAGKLYVLNLGNNTIQKFDSAGHGSLFANTAMDHPQTLAIQIVPEPSSWALLALSAVALLGFGWRKSVLRQGPGSEHETVCGSENISRNCFSRPASVGRLRIQG